MILEGSIEDIIFRNEDNYYTVAKLSTDDGPLTVVGIMPFVNIDETVKLEGDFTYHNDYGEQFKVENVEILIPETLAGIEKYLSSGLIPYIGKKTAKKIVERFKEDTLDKIQENPECLLEIEGIGEKKIEKIKQAFDDQSEIRNIMVFLQQYGITANYSMKIYKKYGNDTVGIIKENPYRLSEDIYGIGFKKADEIAKNMGIEHNSPYRIKGGLHYLLNRSLGDGHIYLPEDTLIKNGRELLEVNIIEVENALMDLSMDGSIYRTSYMDEKIVYLSSLNKAENYVASKLVDIALTERKEIELDLENKIDKIENKDNISFGYRQRQAIEESLKNGLLVITGGPGTGKTTTINSIIKIFENENLRVILAAPTGRAAKRMTETTGREAKTIHRLLEYSFMEEESMAFGLDEDNPVDTDLIIIDEASMIDILLMNSLLKAIKKETRLILVGDVDQLPSVGPGNVLKDIIKSDHIKTVILDEIFRQAEESMIVVNAHRINKGESPFLNYKDKDFFFIKRNNSSDILKTIKDLCESRLPNFYKLDPIKDIQVLSPMKKGDVGVIELNKSLQDVLNPEKILKKEKVSGQTIYRVGDKVMQIKNNYSIEWEVYEDGALLEKGEGIYNGDIGFIKDIDHESNLMTILFDDEKIVEYEFNQLDELQLAYATTVHKSQGSEYPVVVMPMSWGPPMLMTRNLLYTGITRAKTLVVLVGEEKYLNMMIRNNMITKRYSTLSYKIEELFKR